MSTTHLIIGIGLSYLTELIILGILIGTEFLSEPGRGVSRFRRICSYGFAMDAMSVLMTFAFASDSLITKSEHDIVNCLDGLVLWVFLTAGIQLVSEKKSTVKECLILGVPYFVLLASQLFFSDDPKSFVQLAILVTGMAQITYLVVRLRRYDRQLREQKSNVENITTSWFSIYFAVILFELVLWFLSHISPIPSSGFRIVHLLFVQACYLVLAHYAMRQRQADLVEIEVTPETSERQDESDTKVPSLLQNLETLMESGRLYLDPDLSIDRLSVELHTNTTYVYKCIHDGLGTTFYDYVNGLRIKASQNMLENGNATIEEVALNCGFNSSRSFQRAFKRITDKTPSEWRASINK